MDAQDCPVPEVADALKPYIRPRNEVNAIRRGLQGYLQTELHLDGTYLSSVNLAEPPVSHIDGPPPGLSGVRKAYWKALQGHAAAQAKYDALKTELGQLKHDKSGPGINVGKDSSAIINDNYLPLLRQREKQRKLKVVGKALSDVTAAGNGMCANEGLDNMLKKQLGEMPTPPTSQPSGTKSPEVEAKITELKKAIISKKRQVDERKSKTQRLRTTARSELSPQADIAGLQKALQELTSWMESQLTMIANAEAESQPIAESPTREKALGASTPLSTEDIEALYEKYLEARQHLIHTVNDSTTDSADTNIEDFIAPPRRSRSTSFGANSKISPAEAILPYVPTLVALKEEEQSILQHSTLVRRQLSTAEAETDRLIQRLADESHLVQPGTSSCKDWATASREASKESQKFVGERLDAGKGFVNSAQQTLRTIQAMPGSLERLIEDT